MSNGPKFSAASCLAVLRELLPDLRPQCAALQDESMKPAIKCCGSLRRGEAMAGDIDLVYISKTGDACPPGELIPMPGQSLVANAIDQLVLAGVLAYRQKADGSLTNGKWIKLCVHVASGIPVDFYAATHFSFWNLVLCRTGSMQNNIRLADAAKAKGWKWATGGQSPGFEDGFKKIQILSEEHAFDLLGLPYLTPQQR